ncbi:MAG: hypothetical protein ACLUFM_00030 [Lachnospiraceae bacterium]
MLRYFRELSQKDTAQQLGLTQVKISREERRFSRTSERSSADE